MEKIIIDQEEFTTCPEDWDKIKLILNNHKIHFEIIDLEDFEDE